MTDRGSMLEQDPAGRPDVPKAFQDAFEARSVKPTTGFREGTIEVPTEKSLFSRTKRALSKLAERLDSNS